MGIDMDAAAEARLRTYIDQLGDLLGNDGRRTRFAQYAYGLLGEADRKSMEAIATRHVPDPAKADAAHQLVQHSSRIRAGTTMQSDWKRHDMRSPR